MTLLPLLVGCGMGTFVTRQGPEPVRTALYFAPDTSLPLASYGLRSSYLILANSTVPCEPAEVEDAPATAADESLAARAYWEAQLATAFAREGALVVAMVLAVGPEEDWLGRYPLQSDAWELDGMGEYVAEDGRVAAGGWYRVDEAGVDDASGVLYAGEGGIQVLEERHDLAVGAPSWVEVETRDTTMRGSFDFAEVTLNGTFEAELCGNMDLLTTLYAQLGVLALADLAEDTDMPVDGP